MREGRNVVVLGLALSAGLGLAAQTITAKEPVDSTIVKVYAVADLVLTPEQNRAIAERRDKGHAHSLPLNSLGQFTALMDLLQESVAPDSWVRWDARKRPIAEPGRVGTMTPFFLNANLVVRATPAVHEQITTRLEQIRKLPVLGPAEERVETRSRSTP